MAQEKLLVVEDDRNLTKLLTYNLEKEGYRVVAAADGESGLTALRKERPDLVVLDAMMPKWKRFGCAGSSKLETASAYCVDPPGR